MVRSQSQDSLEEQKSQTSSEWTPRKSFPTLTSKVTWSPEKHGWLVRAKQVRSTKQCTKTFAVDPTLLGADFAEAYSSQRRQAVAEWNRCDGTKRDRINLPQHCSALDAQETMVQGILSEGNTRESDGTESGSQPSCGSDWQPMSATDRWLSDTSL